MTTREVAASPARRRRPYEQRELVYVAVARVLVGPLYLVLTYIAGDLTPALAAAVAVTTIYTGGYLALCASQYWAVVDARYLAPVDLAVLAAFMGADGGPESEIRIVFFVWPIAMSMLFSPRFARLYLAAALATYIGVSIPFAADAGFELGDPVVEEFVISALSLAFFGGLSLAVAASFLRRRERLERLLRARKRLLADAMSAEDRARRQTSNALQDSALQMLLAAGQDIDAGLAGNARALDRAHAAIRSTVEELRETISMLHPAALESAGLARALDAVVERAAAIGGLQADVRVDPNAAGVADALLVSVAGELSSKAAEAADAGTISAEVERDRDRVVLTVAIGEGPSGDSGEVEALDPESLGLAICNDRLEAAGGGLEIFRETGPGTLARAWLPATRERAASAAAMRASR